MKILVVDDEQDLREAFAESLNALGFQASDAPSGRQAALRLQSESFDVILSDIRMPDGDGLYLLDQVRAKPEGAPLFIFFSGYSDYTEEELFSRGADGFFAKPCRASAIRDFVTKFKKKAELRWRESSHQPSILLRATISERALGRGGVCADLGSASVPPVGAEVRVELSGWKPKDPLRGVGRVLWVRAPWVGIVWEWVEEQDVQALLDHLAKAQPRAFIPKAESL
jgi:CheY-like chemotaxis protein